MNLDEVKALVERVRSVQSVEDYDGAMSSLRSHLSGCTVVRVSVWGLVLIVQHLHPQFTQEDLDSILKAALFDCVAIREGEGHRVLMGLILEADVRLYDQDIFTSGEATGDSRWSHL